MKKRILFVNNHLRTGGAENSLISLLNQLDFSRFEVDILLFQNDGSYLKRLPKEVNILESGIDSEYFLPFKKSIYRLSISGKFKSLLYRVYASFATKIMRRNFDQVNALVMSLLSSWSPERHYDVAIAYKHMFSYFLIDKVNADRKIAYVHSDYKSYGLNPKYDRPYLNKIDAVATISDGCLNSLKEIFPELSPKVIIAPNIISPLLIKKMAMENLSFNDNFDGIRIITVARLDPIKGIDIAIQTCSMLMDHGYKFKWYIIGGGNPKKYEGMIKELRLENIFIFLGEKTNPYPYIREADIYVQPSRTEGKSIAIEEAKVLCKPIVVTNYPTVSDQIQDGHNGLIVPISSIGIFHGINNMLNHPELQMQLSRNLLEENTGNEKDVEIFYNLISTSSTS
ncbi:glycosyltransferase [Peribacillus simplex]|uniref:glycosyltransferase n=1 Tax=Peribacillus simplex TaxID=1478 RepID=UPI003D2E2ED1